VDDRILFVPPSWSPDPAVLEMFAAFQALLARLRAFLPVDIFIWPWLKTQKVTGTGTECLFNAIRDQVRPHHHVLQAPSGYGEAFLEVLAERQPRSLVVFGFNPSLRTVALLTGGATPPGLQAFWEVSLRDATQLLRLVMAGADEADIQRIAQARDRSYDRSSLLRSAANSRSANLPPSRLWTSRRCIFRQPKSCRPLRTSGSPSFVVTCREPGMKS
jgi:hypothetical protein